MPVGTWPSPVAPKRPAKDGTTPTPAADAPFRAAWRRPPSWCAGPAVDVIEVPADLHDHHALGLAVSTVVDAWGGIDLLVNNAVDTGPGSMVPIVELTVDQMASKLDANVVAQFVLIKAVLPTMLAAGRGTIVNVTSHTATADPPGPVGQGGWGLAYAASKAALHRFAPLLAVELGDRGIRSFNLDPGYVETERQQVNAVGPGPDRPLPGCPALGPRPPPSPGWSTHPEAV